MKKSFPFPLNNYDKYKWKCGKNDYLTVNLFH